MNAAQLANEQPDLFGQGLRVCGWTSERVYPGLGSRPRRGPAYFVRGWRAALATARVLRRCNFRVAIEKK